MVLVDTSVWVEHLRRGHAALEALLEQGEVLVHPFVTGELACGNLKNRAEVLTLIQTLPRTAVAEHDEVLRFVEGHRLQEQGLGWVDAHLLASARLTQCELWSLDKAMARSARDLGLHTR